MNPKIVELEDTCTDQYLDWFFSALSELEEVMAAVKTLTGVPDQYYTEVRASLTDVRKYCGVQEAKQCKLDYCRLYDSFLKRIISEI